MKKEVFTVPRDELFTYWVQLARLRGADCWHPLLGNGVITEVELKNNDDMGMNDEIRLRVCSPDVQSTEAVAKEETTIKAVLDKFTDTDTAEWIKMLKQSDYDSDVKDFHLELHDAVLTAMCEERGLEVGQRITNVVLTNDGVEFTMV